MKCSRLFAQLLVGSCILAPAACAPLNQNSAVSSASGATPIFDSSSPFDRSPTSKEGDIVTVDVGNGIAVKQDASNPFRMAYLIQGTDNTWLQGHVRGAKDQAAKLGIDLTVFDAGFDSQTQYSQYQNALATGQYDAFIVIAADSVGSCEILSSTAPKSDILVGIVNQPICNRGNGVRMDAWTPGTVSTVLGTGSPEYFDAVADSIASRLTEPTTFAYVTGPAGNTSVEAQRRSLEEAARRYPNFTLSYTAYTDFSASAALSETQNLMAAHKEIGGIVSNFTSLSTGIIEGLKSAGRTDVRLFDSGGSQQAIDMLNADDIEASAAYFPYSASACMVDVLFRAHNGESVPRVVLNDCRPNASNGAEEQPTVVVKDDIDTFRPEY